MTSVFLPPPDYALPAPGPNEVHVFYDSGKEAFPGEYPPNSTSGGDVYLRNIILCRKRPKLVHFLSARQSSFVRCCCEGQAISDERSLPVAGGRAYITNTTQIPTVALCASSTFCPLPHKKPFFAAALPRFPHIFVMPVSGSVYCMMATIATQYSGLLLLSHTIHPFLYVALSLPHTAKLSACMSPHDFAAIIARLNYEVDEARDSVSYCHVYICLLLGLTLIIIAVSA